MYLVFIIGVVCFLFGASASYGIIKSYPAYIPTPRILLELSTFIMTFSVFLGILIIIEKKNKN